MAKRLPYLLGSLAIACWGAAAGAQTTQFSIDFGFQWIDTSGNRSLFRSQVNERQGFLLRSFTLTSTAGAGASGLFDRLRLDAEGLGESPDGRLHLEAGLAGLYNLRLTYSHAEYFNALPDFANPLLATGFIPGEYTMDRTTHRFDLDVEALPGRTVTPLFSYSWMRTSGPGRTTYQIGQDEFRLDESFAQTTQEVSAGVGLHLGRFAGTIRQGWRVFDQTDSTSLAPGAGGGNNAAPVLGTDVNLSSYTGHTSDRGTTPMTSGYVSGFVADRVRLVASFVRADFNSHGDDADVASGSLASFALARFFEGRSEAVRSRADSLSWRGNARVEAQLVEGLDLVAGYTKRHRELDGWATIADLYTGTVNFSGADPRDIATLLEARTAMTRDDRAFEARLALSSLGPVRLWAGWSNVKEDVSVTPDAAEVVVPGGQFGDYAREVKRTSAGATLLLGGLRVGVDWQKDDGDAAVVRTQFLNAERWRGRVSWTAGKLLQLVGTAERVTGDNPTAGIDHDLTTRHYQADATLTPLAGLGVRFGYGVFKVDSRITVRQPQDFSLVPSLYIEDGTSKEIGLDYRRGRFSFGAGTSRFSNDGSVALDLLRTTAHADFDLTQAWGVSAQFDRRNYEQAALPIANYTAAWYGVFLRWHHE